MTYQRYENLWKYYNIRLRQNIKFYAFYANSVIPLFHIDFQFFIQNCEYYANIKYFI